MEEIEEVSKIYLKNTVNFAHFGWRGLVLLILGFPIFLLMGWLVFTGHPVANSTTAMLILILLLGVFWKPALNLYRVNLCSHLSIYTGLNNADLKNQKAAYLKTLSAHFGESNFEAMQKIIALRDICNSNRQLTPENFGYFLSRFIYNSDAKARINGWIIYLFSFVVILLVTSTSIRNNPDIIFEILDAGYLKDVLTWGSLTILVFFGFGFIMFSTLLSALIKPLLLVYSNKTTLVNNLISDLARYSFIDEKIKISGNSEAISSN